MSYTKQVTTPSGVTKTVIADSESELNEAVEAVKQERNPVGIDINVPVRKGRDLPIIEEDGVVQGLADARGAHNSPRPALRDDGTVEGQPEVPVLVQKRNLNTSDTTAENLKKVESDGKLTDYTAEDAPAEEATKASKKTSK